MIEIADNLIQEEQNLVREFGDTAKTLNDALEKKVRSRTFQERENYFNKFANLYLKSYEED
jgi:hypothetical protein